MDHAQNPRHHVPAAEEAPLHGFLALLEPLIEAGRSAVKSALRGRAALEPFPEPTEAERILFASLPPRLLARIDRTLVLELNVARLEGRLSGATPAERFGSFVALLREDEHRRRILAEYPVLVLGALEIIESWRRESLALADRLWMDWKELRPAFFAFDPGLLTAVRTGMGDPHRRGQSVAILEFESGARLVYKPRPMEADRHFQELLAWLAARGAPDHRTVRILDRGDYGWMEYVEAEPCGDEAAVLRYHHRLGSLLAVLYAFGGVDVHFENLIAAGEQPVAIDLESLLHPPPHRRRAERPDERLMNRALTESVLRVGLLPFQVRESGEEESSQSGVAVVAGALSRDPVMQWEGAGGDEMRLVKKRIPMPAGHNLATFGGTQVDAAEHAATVALGFEATYTLLVREREAILGDGGPLSWFARDRARMVLRATRAYGMLLEESWHPDFQRDVADRDRFLERIRVGVDEFASLEPVIRYERRDLARGDIPYFATRADSRDLWGSDGERIANYLEATPLDLVRERLLGMSEDDRARQSWLVRVSLGTLLLNRKAGDWPRYSLEDPAEPSGAGGPGPAAGSGGTEASDALREPLIVEARRLGDWFERMAFRDGDELTWVTLDLREGNWALVPCSEDLYAGLPGVALFLGYLAAVTGEKRYAALARAGVRTLLGRLPHVATNVGTIGLYQGWGGIVYTLAHLGRALDDGTLLGEAERLVGEIESRLEEDRELDVVGGAAGAIGGLLALYAATGSERALAVARRCGEHLLAAARPAGPGIGWPIRIAGDEPQAGFAHGAAGIAAALASLARSTGDVRFLDAARQASRFERERLWPELERWMEEDAAAGAGVRQAESELPMSWCYGAPGIALSRLLCLRAVEDGAAAGDGAAVGDGVAAEDGAADDEALALAEIARAATLIVERGFGTNHSLCHGDLGNLDILTQVSPLLNARETSYPTASGVSPDREGRETEWHETTSPRRCSSVVDRAIARTTRALLASIRAEGWRPGTVAGVESPGLMNGLAGIGLGLLRLADPARVPSVVAMDPPSGGSRGRALTVGEQALTAVGPNEAATPETEAGN
ncbi:MAG: type 2 lanthipeptide synthetase LanM family protein [Bacteroidota bacterium]